MRVALLAVIALVAGCAHAAHGSPAPAPIAAPAGTPKDIVAAAKGTIERWRQAYEVRSLDALEALYLHDLDVVVVQQGAALIGWSSVDAMLKDRLARATEIHVRLADVHIAALTPEVATAIATMTRDVSDGVKSVAESGTLTLVLHKVGDVWLITAEHYSYRLRT